MDSFQRYLQALRGPATDNEIAFYTPLSRYLLEGVLHYDADKEISINRREEPGRPDLILFSPVDRSPWIAGEVKLDDEDVRNDRRREKIWREQIVGQGYLLPAAFYVLLIAPYTFRVCDLDGEVLAGFDVLREGDMVGQAGDVIAIKANGACAGTAENVREILHLITRETAEQAPQYVAFREGRIKSGRIPLDVLSLRLLEEVVNRATRDLTAYCRRAFHQLRKDCEVARREVKKLWDQVERVRQLGVLVPPARLRQAESRALHRERKAQPLFQIFDFDYPMFGRDQAYAGVEAQKHTEELFLSNTAYVALCRLVFVRICEDTGLTAKKISNSGVAAWRHLVSQIKDRYQSLLRLAFEDVSYIYSRLFEEQVFDWFGQTDGDLSQIIERTLFELNAFSFERVDRDLLGQMYQTLRPRAERKRLGEYYTDEPIVDFILRRVGLLDDPDLMQKRILDPACGSFTFGIRALSHLLDRAEGQALSPANVLELGRRVVHGWDINPFAAFLSHLSTLLLFLRHYLEAQKRSRTFELEGFSICHVNSLAVAAQTEAEGGEQSSERKAATVLADGFDYVVGNPPFVRNERVPEEDREFLEKEFAEIREKNTDLSAFFIYSAFKRWLKPGGRFGMVAPIGLLNAGMAAPLRKFLSDKRIDEIVSLEWMATEIFEGTDIVPILLFGTNAPAPKRHAIRLVSGLRSVKDLIACVQEPRRVDQFTSKIPYKRFLDLSPTGDWPVEVTAADLPVLDHLRKAPTLAEIIKCSYAVKAGAGDRVRVETEPGGDKVPWLRGQHICQFAADYPKEYVSIAQVNENAADPSIWRWIAFYEHNRGKASEDGFGRSDLEIPPKERASFPKDFRIPSDSRVVSWVEIHPTLNSCVVDPLQACCHNTCLIGTPLRYSAHVIGALINCGISRYYAFMLLRAAILLRRRAHWYPRTIEGLPLPKLNTRAVKRLHQLAVAAEKLSLGQPPGALELYEKESERLARDKAGFLGVTCEGSGRIDLAVLERAAVKDNRLAIGPIAIAAPNDDLLILLRTALLSAGADDVAPDEIQSVLLPRDAAERRRLAAQVVEFEKTLRSTEDAMHEIEEEIDVLVAEGLGLTPQMHEIIKKRCTEFPLSVTVGAPRYIWSADRKVQAQRLYKEGERYSEE
jgi:hypothetical protein